MNLYWRIILGYGLLFALLVASALGASVAFRELGQNIGLVLDENYGSIKASVRMIESLERHDSAILALLAEPDSSRDPLQRARNEFRSGLAEARGNITIEEERPTLDRIERDFTLYGQACGELLEQPGELSLATYESATQPLFRSVKDGVLRLMDLNHEAMIQADRSARAYAQARAAISGLMVALAALTVIPLVRSVSRNVLGRLQHLREVAEAIAGGDHMRRVSVDRDDELGLFGRQLNAMLDRQLELESDVHGRLAAERQLVLGLLNALPTPAALLTPAGRLVASTLPATSGAALLGMLRDHPEVFSGNRARQALSREGAAFELCRLDAGGGRLVGWLARAPEPEA